MAEREIFAAVEAAIATNDKRERTIHKREIGRLLQEQRQQQKQQQKQHKEEKGELQEELRELRRTLDEVRLDYRTLEIGGGGLSGKFTRVLDKGKTFRDERDVLAEDVTELIKERDELKVECAELRLRLERFEELERLEQRYQALLRVRDRLVSQVMVLRLLVGNDSLKGGDLSVFESTEEESTEESN